MDCYGIAGPQPRHCEEPSGDEAIQRKAQTALDCFATLAMTK